jgi:hypothetical protein
MPVGIKKKGNTTEMPSFFTEKILEERTKVFKVRTKLKHPGSTGMFI